MSHLTSEALLLLRSARCTKQGGPWSWLCAKHGSVLPKRIPEPSCRFGESGLPETSILLWRIERRERWCGRLLSESVFLTTKHCGFKIFFKNIKSFWLFRLSL